MLIQSVNPVCQVLLVEEVASLVVCTGADVVNTDTTLVLAPGNVPGILADSVMSLSALNCSGLGMASLKPSLIDEVSVLVAA